MQQVFSKHLWTTKANKAKYALSNIAKLKLLPNKTQKYGL